MKNITPLWRFFYFKLTVCVVSLMSACGQKTSPELNTKTTVANGLPQMQSTTAVADPRGHDALHQEMTTSSHANVTLPAIERLIAFHDAVRRGARYSSSVLREIMDERIHELDSLAQRQYIANAKPILNSLDSAQKAAILNAQLETSSDVKGLWLRWSERLFLTRDGLRHFFSEIFLNNLEKAVDQQNIDDADTHLKQLFTVVHRDHERRVISMLRRLKESDPIYGKIFDLLASSGGPLSRLYFYQKFITQPSLDFANALARVGLPRISDLIGKGVHVTENVAQGRAATTLVRERWLNEQRLNFQEQWAEFKKYFTELQQIPTRNQEARVKWVELHEEVSYTINLITADNATKHQLRDRILQTFGSKENPWEHAYRHDGIEFREGDIILLQNGTVGGLWETLTQSGSLLSHLMMVHFGSDGVPYTVEMNYGQLLLAPLDLDTDRYTVIRASGLTQDDRRAIHATLSKMLNSDIGYDFRFDSSNSHQLYCSELVGAVFKSAGLSRQLHLFPAASKQAQSLLHGAGIRAKEFYTQGSYIGGQGFSHHAERLNSDPRDFIRGSLVLEGFSNYLAHADSVRLSRHPDANQLFAMSALAQTVNAKTRRALGPPRFLFTALVLDKLIHKLEEEARRAQLKELSQRDRSESRIVELKHAIANTLARSIPQHLAEIFPRSELTPSERAK